MKKSILTLSALGLVALAAAPLAALAVDCNTSSSPCSPTASGLNGTTYTVDTGTTAQNIYVKVPDAPSGKKWGCIVSTPSNPGSGTYFYGVGAEKVTAGTKFQD